LKVEFYNIMIRSFTRYRKEKNESTHAAASLPWPSESNGSCQCRWLLWIKIVSIIWVTLTVTIIEGDCRMIIGCNYFDRSILLCDVRKNLSTSIIVESAPETIRRFWDYWNGWDRQQQLSLSQKLWISLGDNHPTWLLLVRLHLPIQRCISLRTFHIKNSSILNVSHGIQTSLPRFLALSAWSVWSLAHWMSLKLRPSAFQSSWAKAHMITHGFICRYGDWHTLYSGMSNLDHKRVIFGPSKRIWLKACKRLPLRPKTLDALKWMLYQCLHLPRKWYASVRVCFLRIPKFLCITDSTCLVCKITPIKCLSRCMLNFVVADYPGNDRPRQFPTSYHL